MQRGQRAGRGHFEFRSVSRAVEISIRGLNQRGLGCRWLGVERRQISTKGDLENCATVKIRPSGLGRSIEVTVSSLNKRAWSTAVGGVGWGTKIVKSRFRSSRRDLEYYARIILILAIGAAKERCSVETAAGSLNKRARSVTVRAESLGTKAVERCQCACWGDLKDRTCDAGAANAAVGSASPCRPVKIPVSTLNQGPVRIEPVGAVGLSAEAVKCCQCTLWRESKNCSAAMGTAVFCRPVEVAIGSQD
jgi:hypothetical protein